jgi:putative adhesin
MSNQEMQFADPDWKPSQQLNSNNIPQEQEEYTPQPINSDYREQNKWGSAPSSSPQQEGYTGLRPYTGSVPRQMQGGNYRQRPYSRRGRGPWFWIILAFIIFSLISGGSRFSSGFGNGPDFGHNSFEHGQMMGKPIDYTVSGQATIVINDLNGNVTVIEGQSNTDVSFQTVGGNSFSGNSNDIQQGISQNGDTITATTQDPVDLQVTVPNGANLSLNTGSGNISFDGTFDTTGTTQFQTTNGDITVTVPSSSSFHLDASTNSGSISSDFPNVNVQNNTSGSGQSVNGVVGGGSQSQVPNVVIKSVSGDINLNQK